MRALVTGASGFVGLHLCAHLRAAGDQVTAVDARAEVAIDITDPALVDRVIADANAEVVYHLAALAHVGESWRERDVLHAVNVGGTANVLEACRKADVRRVVVVGSSEQYGSIGPEVDLVSETQPMKPVSPYGESKVAAEELAHAAVRDHRLGVVCVRAFNHTGPGQAPTFLVPGLAARIAAAERSGDQSIVLGNLDPVRDFSDVRDVVRAYRLLAEHGQPGEAYNVCSGHGVAVAELAERLVGRATRPLTIAVDPELVRPVDVPRLVGDATKLVNATGWQPQHDLDDTLADVLDFARRASS